MLFFYLVLLVLSLVALAWSASMGRYALFVFVAFLVFYLMLRPLMLLSGSYEIFAWLHGGLAFDPNYILPVAIYSSMASILFGLGYLSQSFGVMAEVRRPRIVKDESIWVMLFVSSSIFVFSPSISIVGQSLGFIFFCVAVVLLSRRRYIQKAFVFALAVVVLQFSDDRRDWAILLLILLGVAVMRRKGSMLRLAAFGMLALLSLVYISVAMRSGDDSAFERIMSAGILLVEVELDFSLVFDDIALLFAKVPEVVDYQYGRLITKPFYSFIPRDIWPEKPETLSREFSRVFNPSFYRSGGSQPLTFVGELYWNFGWLSVVFLFFWGMLLGRWDSSLVGERKNSGELVFQVPCRQSVAYYLGLIGMTFFIYRGPIDTFWLSYVAFFFYRLLLCWMDDILSLLQCDWKGR